MTAVCLAPSHIVKCSLSCPTTKTYHCWWIHNLPQTHTIYLTIITISTTTHNHHHSYFHSTSSNSFSKSSSKSLPTINHHTLNHHTHIHFCDCLYLIGVLHTRLDWVINPGRSTRNRAFQFYHLHTYIHHLLDVSTSHSRPTPNRTLY